MNDFAEKYGPWALVTGSSSGLGEEFARQLASLGFNLVLLARRFELLIALADELRERTGVDLRVAPVDLTEPDFYSRVEPIIRDITIGLLVNNAGFATTGEFVANDPVRERCIVDLNCRAPLILSHAVGGAMVRRGRGGIINVASLAGFLPMPHWTSYAASKAFLLHFSEALWHELRPRGVDVLTLCPGATRTEFGLVSGTRQGGMDPRKVASQAIKALGKRPLVVPGARNRFVSFLTATVTRTRRIGVGARIVERIKA